MLRKLPYVTIKINNEAARVEVERAWARARRPGPKIRLVVHKPKARESPGLISVGSAEPKTGFKPVKPVFKLV